MDKIYQERYKDFGVLLERSFEGESLAKVTEAFELAAELLEGRKRYDGTPLLDHAVKTTEIVISEIGLGTNSSIATLLHDASRLGLLDTETVQKQFGAVAASIIKGMNSISGIQTKASMSQADNFRDLIVSYSSDPRIILIKLADRLEVMRSLEMFPEQKRIQKSWESMNLYAQIAHKLGLYPIKSELEDRSLQFLEPADYAMINRKLEESAAERSRFISEFTRPIIEKLDSQGIKYHIKSRTKSTYSIWRKMKRMGVAFEEIYDIFAIRIIVECPPEQEKQMCWNIYSIVTDFYTPNPERMRDWISIPKSNGYESLHTTVVTDTGKWVEIQIRSERMDEIAERGIAAHWRYKGVHGGGSRNDEWLARLREIMEESTNKRQITNRIDTNSTSNEIFVFTPSGDLRKLPQGATVLDFAFDIHSQIGSTCTGARIGGKNVSLREELKNGDIVSITTSKTQTPKAHWLNYVITSKARNKIKSYLREEASRTAQLGREELERRLKNWKLNIPIDEAVAVLAKYYKHKNGTEIYSAIANGEVEMPDIKECIVKFLEGGLFEPKTRPVGNGVHGNTSGSESKKDMLIIEDSVQGLDYKLGRCCNPIFGDEIFGFTTVSAGITIHRKDCPNARRLREEYPYRILEAHWNSDSKQGKFLSSIHIVAEDITGIATRITETISTQLKINIRSMSLSPIRKGLLSGTIVIEVANAAATDMVIANLMKIKGMEKASPMTAR